jgi:ribonuclease P protein component
MRSSSRRPMLHAWSPSGRPEGSPRASAVDTGSGALRDLAPDLARTPQHRRSSREQAHVPAEQPAPSQGARLPSADAYPGRPRSLVLAPPQGPRPRVGLTGSGHPGSVVLERRHRLTSTTGFVATTRGGRRAGTRTLVLHLAVRSHPGAPPRGAPAPDVDDAPRVGFAVGRPVGNAVIRNRVRRRLRHLVAERLTRLPAACDLVVRGLPPAAEATYSALGRDLDKALVRLGLAEPVQTRENAATTP